MLDFFSRLFDVRGFPRRWDCGSWTAEHGWLHILSDLGVWSAYIAIPCVLGYFAIRRKDVPFRSIFWLFGAFILACGTTHLMEAIIFWWPLYRLAGVIKLFTALVSWGTVIALIPVTPKALAMRSPEELEREIAERQRAEAKLQNAYVELDSRVQKRTSQLAHAVAELQTEAEKRQSIAQENARLYAEARQAGRRKDEFLATLAHELRNPLSAIVSGIEFLRRGGTDDPDLRRSQDIVMRQAQLLTRLVDDLLDVSRISRGHVQLQLQLVDLASVVARAVETSQPLINAKRHQLNVSVPPTPIYLHADPARLAQVLVNLLHNAAKFTDPEGKIWLTATLEDHEAIIKVRDTGVGIPAEILGNVFDLFMQAEQSLDRSQGGLGIGLNLVRNLVMMQGGTVTANSQGEGQGSEFVVRLPVAAEPARGEIEPAAAPVATKPLRILVVDDNTDTAQVLVMLMRSEGHEATMASDGPAALQAARELHPDVVLLDIGLPGMSGFEVCRLLRQESGIGQPMVAALTGYGQDQDRARSRAAGFDAHLVKPVTTHQLRELLQRASTRDRPQSG